MFANFRGLVLATPGFGDMSNLRGSAGDAPSIASSATAGSAKRGQLRHGAQRSQCRREGLLAVHPTHHAQCRPARIHRLRRDGLARALHHRVGFGSRLHVEGGSRGLRDGVAGGLPAGGVDQAPARRRRRGDQAVRFPVRKGRRGAHALPGADERRAASAPDRTHPRQDKCDGQHAPRGAARLDDHQGCQHADPAARSGARQDHAEMECRKHEDPAKNTRPMVAAALPKDGEETSGTKGCRSWRRRSSATSST